MTTHRTQAVRDTTSTSEIVLAKKKSKKGQKARSEKIKISKHEENGDDVERNRGPFVPKKKGKEVQVYKHGKFGFGCSA